VNTDRLSSEQWSQYWRRDSITTFSRRFNENYDGEFQVFWDAQFEALPHGARIVDLATGNGAIALLAQQYARAHAKAFQVTGLDYAQIDPVTILASHEGLMPLLAEIKFLSGVPVENTGLADDSVDLLTSQYGFEYAQREAAGAEAWRVLKPGGHMALILHHTESAVVGLAKDGLSQVRFCLKKEELDKRVTALVRAMGEATSTAERRALKHNPKTERLRQKLNASVARINQRADRYRDPEGFIGVIVPNLLNVFAAYKGAGMSQKLSYIRDIRSAFDSFRERMADLQGAALSPSVFDELCELLESTGFLRAHSGTMHYRGDLMGWSLIVRKPASRRKTGLS